MEAARPERHLAAMRWDEIEGWYGHLETALLTGVCGGVWCEIGAYKGRSAAALATTGHDGYVIDTFLAGKDTEAECRRNLAAFPYVRVIRSDFKDAVDAVPDQLQLLHLDADHSYEQTKLAFDLYSPKVVQEGCVAFHDARGGGWPGVERFVDELDPTIWRDLASAELTRVYQRR